MENQENIQRRNQYNQMLENTSDATDFIYRKQNDKLQDFLDEKKPVFTYDLLSAANGIGNIDAFERVMKAPNLESEAKQVVSENFNTFLYSASATNQPDVVKHLLDNVSNGRFEIKQDDDYAEQHAEHGGLFHLIKTNGAAAAAQHGHKQVLEVIVQSAEQDGQRFSVKDLEQFKHFARNSDGPESKDSVSFLSGKIAQQKAEMSKARTATKSKSRSMSI